MQTNIRITGPTSLPPEVLNAISTQMMSHRSNSFREYVHRIVPKLQRIFGTTEIPLLFTASGTGGLEAAIVNTIKQDQKVLAIKIGLFGERFSEIAKTFGADVTELEFPWGQPIDPEAVRKSLRQMGKVDAVLLTHNETSTGVLNPLPKIMAVIRSESEALVLVDGMSSVGGIPVEMDKHGIDVMITASQKALMAPPGLTILAASSRALKAASKQNVMRYYFDFLKMREEVLKGSTTYTPAVSTIYGLDAALFMIENEGLTNVYQRHQQLGKLLREGMVAMGLRCFAKQSFESPTVTNLILPDGFSATEVRSKLESEYGVFISQGRKPWNESMLRMGHMGWVSEAHIQHLLNSVHSVLAQ